MRPDEMSLEEQLIASQAVQQFRKGHMDQSMNRQQPLRDSSFEYNVAETLSLKYASGKRVDSRYHDYELYYSLADGRSLYASPDLGEKIAELAPRPGQPFTVLRSQVREGNKKRVEWRLALVNGAQPEQRIPQPAAPEAIRQPSGSPDSRNSSQDSAGRPSMGAVMRAALKASIDSLLEAQAYGASKGLTLDWNEEDVRATANTLFIQYVKGSL